MTQSRVFVTDNTDLVKLKKNSFHIYVANDAFVHSMSDYCKYMGYSEQDGVSKALEFNLHKFQKTGLSLGQYSSADSETHLEISEHRINKFSQTSRVWS